MICLKPTLWRFRDVGYLLAIAVLAAWLEATETVFRQAESLSEAWAA